ncbi:unnamed protein product [Closterium sp. NIES-54]
MGGSRMHHRRTSDVHDHANAALCNPILLRCKDQSPHRADAASTTHGAAEGWRRRENAAAAAAAAAAAGADRLQCCSAAKLHSDHLRYPRLRLHRRHRLHLRYHRHRCRRDLRQSRSSSSSSSSASSQERCRGGESSRHSP